jgi:hypothetical protein
MAGIGRNWALIIGAKKIAQLKIGGGGNVRYKICNRQAYYFTRYDSDIVIW